jgi:1-acyl-sn-glycerol-3-phosphate acyltransferase
MILLAALPRPFGFVAKGELQRSYALRRFLQRLGTEFVDRFDAERGVRDAARLIDTVSHGRSLLFFPEGTFARPGTLLPFHLGAFLTAVRAHAPLIPVVLRGNRELLPDGRWWPRPAQLDVEVCEPLMPFKDDANVFSCALNLRSAAQRSIAVRL